MAQVWSFGAPRRTATASIRVHQPSTSNCVEATVLSSSVATGSCAGSRGGSRRWPVLACGSRSLRLLRHACSVRRKSAWLSIAAPCEKDPAAAGWALLPATCAPRRHAVVSVSAAFVGGGAVAIGGVLASVGRLLFTSPATKALLRSILRTARPLLTGPFSVILLVVAVVGAAVTAVRSRIMSSVRACKDCRGYGIERCPLCGGMGLVGWEGKWNHEEPCPMCLARRYVNCRACGGLYHRSIFVHVRSKAQKLLEIDTPTPRNMPSEYFSRLTGD